MGYFEEIVKGVPKKPVHVPGTSQLVGISCWSVTACEAAANGDSGKTNDTDGVVSIRKGKSGRFIHVAGVAIMEGISCANSKSCEMDGQGPDKKNGDNGGVVVAVHGGKPKGAVTVPGSIGVGVDLFGISCSAHNVCVAVGSGIFGPVTDERVESLVATITSGKPASARMDPSINLDGVSCYSSGDCKSVGVDQRCSSDCGIVVPIRNGSPGTESKVAGSSWLYGIACTAADFCEASGNVQTSGEGNSEGVEFNVGSGASRVAGSSNLDVMSCPKRGKCEAGGANSNVAGSQEGLVVGSL